MPRPDNSEVIWIGCPFFTPLAPLGRGAAGEGQLAPGFNNKCPSPLTPLPKGARGTRVCRPQRRDEVGCSNVRESWSCMDVVIAGIGTALPEHQISQTLAGEASVAYCCDEPGQARSVGALYRMSGVETRRQVNRVCGPYRTPDVPPAFRRTDSRSPVDESPRQTSGRARRAIGLFVRASPPS